MKDPKEGDTIGAGTNGVPQPDQFDSLGEWFRYVREEGFSVPVQVPHAISRVMEAFGFDHQEAFDWLMERGLLLVSRGVVVVDLRATHVDLRTVPDNGLD